VNKVKYDVLVVLAIGTVTNHTYKLFLDKFLDLSPTVPAFLGTAISILLSFKMNQSYDRWWEARKVWGAIVNDSRSFVLQLQAFVDENHAGHIKVLAYRQMAWCYSLGQSLRGLDPLANMADFLNEEDIEALRSHNNKPLGILQQNALELRKLRDDNAFDVFSQVHLDATLVRLCDSMGKAERIKTTVFPSTYRKFLHFAIYVFVTLLSISLKNVGIAFELVLLLSVSMCFFLVEKSAYHLQNPFSNRPSDTAVTAIAMTIEINIRQLLGEKKVPQPVEPERFYVM
jgi:putative membrane protein